MSAWLLILIPILLACALGATIATRTFFWAQASTTYYFDATGGDDENTGTSEEQAWQTLAKFRTEEAGGTFQPGDTIRFKAGQVWTSDVWRCMEITTCSGSEGSPITITRYGHGPNPIIDGADHAVRHLPMPMENVSYWDVEHLEFCHFNRSAVVRATNYSHHINFRYLYIHDIGNGLANWAAGINFSGEIVGDGPTYCSAEYCRVENVDGEGIYSGDGNVLDGAHHITVKGCVVINCAYEGLEIKSSVSNSTFTGCLIRDCGGPGSAADISLSGVNNIVQDTIVDSSNPAQAIYIGQYTLQTNTNLTLRRCTISTTQDYAIRLHGDGHTIEHNTTIGGAIAGLWVRSPNNEHNHTIRHNRFRNSGTYSVYWDTTAAAGYTFDYNHYCDGSSDVWYYQGSARTLAYVQETIGKETNGDASCTTGTYYVDSDAESDGDGTLESPWNTLSHANELDRGDTLRLRGDSESYQVYDEEIFVAIIGTSESPFTIQPYTDELVELRSDEGSRVLTVLGPYVTITGDEALRIEGQDYADRLLHVDATHFTMESADLKSCAERAIHATDRADSLSLDQLTIQDVSAAIVLDGPTTVTLQRTIIHSLLSSGSDPDQAYQAAIVIINAASDVDVFNNTVEDSPENSLYLSNTGLSDVIIRNNIFKDAGAIENEGAEGLTYDHNCWNGCSETLSGTCDVTGDPLFADESGHDYTLQSNSPCIDAGVDVGLDYQGDAPDMGALESTPGAPGGEPPPRDHRALALLIPRIWLIPCTLATETRQ
jgi:hypothetical protein